YSWLTQSSNGLRAFAVSSHGGAHTGVRLSAFIYRWVQCRIRIRRRSSRILLLTTIGYDSGTPQTDAIGYFEEGDDLFVVASNYGSDQHSSWYLNLRAHPKVDVRIDENRREMTASTATPAERTRLLGRLATDDKQYGHYQRKTARQIPIVLLYPVSSQST
ncbi:MAG TPA: nitroreductase/quinone reductase family protein, partial [Ktedonobacterales bacterium]|nr:nitroreductase/quinone reductase family protein [Ktedonobacterales bacterium]